MRLALTLALNPLTRFRYGSRGRSPTQPADSRGLSRRPRNEDGVSKPSGRVSIRLALTLAYSPAGAVSIRLARTLALNPLTRFRYGSR
ncbi:hypothetical protein GCM10027052_11410 [Parafrigoribacterium mesophilum]